MEYFVLQDMKNYVLLICKIAFRKNLFFKKKIIIKSTDTMYSEISNCINELNLKTSSLHVFGKPLTIKFLDNKFQFESKDLKAIRKVFHFTPLYANYYKRIFRHYGRKVTYKLHRYLSKWAPNRIFDRRAPQTGGKLIALIGVDGSGKSSHVKKLYNTLSWKLSVNTAYLGSGDGPGWYFRRALTKFLIKQKRSNVAKNLLKNQENQKSLKRDIVYIIIGIHALILACERFSKVKKIQKAIQNNIVIISDRWPHNYSGGVLDGPVNVFASQRNIITQLLSRLEQYAYDKINMTDLKIGFIFLETSFEDTMKRKPGELSLEDYNRRVDVIKKIKGNTEHVFNIKTTPSMELVEKDVFEATWKILNDL